MGCSTSTTSRLDGLKLRYHPEYEDVCVEFPLNRDFDRLFDYCSTCHAIEYGGKNQDGYFWGEMIINRIRYYIGADEESGNIRVSTTPDYIAAGLMDHDLHAMDGCSWMLGNPETDSQWFLFVAPLRELSRILTTPEVLGPDDCPLCPVKIRPEGGHLCGRCGRDI